MNDYGLKEVHKDLFMVLCDFDRVCRDNKIKYSLMCGTLLGAIREKGFIPWDDDLDVVMSRDAYEAFAQAYPGSCEPEYELDLSQTWVPRVKKCGGKAFLDIFILDGISEHIVLSRIKIFVLKTLQGMMKKKVKYENYSPGNRILLGITGAAGKIFPFRMKFKIYQVVSAKLFCGNGKYVHMSDGAFHLLSVKWKKDIFTSFTETAFESGEFYVTSKFQEVLIVLYGRDYMTPPPPDQRVVLHLDI